LISPRYAAAAIAAADIGIVVFARHRLLMPPYATIVATYMLAMMLISLMPAFFITPLTPRFRFSDAAYAYAYAAAAMLVFAPILQSHASAARATIFSLLIFSLFRH